MPTESRSAVERTARRSGCWVSHAPVGGSIPASAPPPALEHRTHSVMPLSDRCGIGLPTRRRDRQTGWVEQSLAGGEAGGCSSMGPSDGSVTAVGACAAAAPGATRICGARRVRGVGGRGREVLTFLPGADPQSGRTRRLLCCARPRSHRRLRPVARSARSIGRDRLGPVAL
jgi:hypothetical protein